MRPKNSLACLRRRLTATAAVDRGGIGQDHHLPLVSSLSPETLSSLVHRLTVAATSARGLPLLLLGATDCRSSPHPRLPLQRHSLSLSLSPQLLCSSFGASRHSFSWRDRFWSQPHRKCTECTCSLPLDPATPGHQTPPTTTPLLDILDSLRFPSPGFGL